MKKISSSGLIMGVLTLAGLLGAALLAPPAQAFVSGPGPYLAPPAWDRQLGAGRFLVLTNWNQEAVLDKETGLVWERSPTSTVHTWVDARFQCTSRTTGGRKGWRLPSVHELASLMDPNNQGGNPPHLPPGHPFNNVQSDFYWSATTVVGDPSRAWGVFFFLDGGEAINARPDSFPVWCVRGGMNAEVY